MVIHTCSLLLADNELTVKIQPKLLFRKRLLFEMKNEKAKIYHEGALYSTYSALGSGFSLSLNGSSNFSIQICIKKDKRGVVGGGPVPLCPP